VNDEGEWCGTLGELFSDGVLGGFDEGVERDVVIVEESRHPPDGGVGLCGSWESRNPGDRRVDGVGVPFHDLVEAVLEPLVQITKKVAMLALCPD
jgi:hypothetical protein